MISCPFCNTRIYKKSPKAKEIKQADSDKTQEDLSADESTDIESFYNEAIDQIEYNDRYKDLSNGAYPSVKIFGDEYEDEDKDGLVQPNSKQS